ncbi:multicopper oxidase-domain-containing protein [Xylariales sp. AK1849]|nr:multicopper oxidase-domain-containing protein [Xylariales sp. AK1849]
MGWLKDCVEFTLQITQLNIFSPFTSYDGTQQPLQLQHQQPPSVNTAGTCAGAQCSKPKAFQCEYPGWELCNTETSRDCWIRDPTGAQPEFNISTDYENRIPPGITREYWLEVTTNETVKPDGIDKIMGNYFNGSYPGPVLEACWGDQLVIHVTNKVATNGSTIHWHGIRQLNSNEMDGVNGITQCPIAGDGHDMTYNFTAQQYGHTWYHSHYSLQYADGVAAPLVIHGPNSANWDIDLGPILIADWVHKTAFELYSIVMQLGAVVTDSILVNGHGHYWENPEAGSYYQTCFTPGKKHRIQLINGAIGTDFIFSIDNHTLTVVANDLVAIEPFQVDSLFIGIGQRYTVIVEAKADTDNDFWMRTVPAATCGAFDMDHPPDTKTAIVRYNSASDVCPEDWQNPQNTTCADVHSDLLNPILPWKIDTQPHNDVVKDTFFARIQNHTDLTLGPPGDPYIHWLLQDNPMWLDFGSPTILDIDHALSDPNYVVIEEDYNQGFVYLVLDASHGRLNVGGVEIVVNVTHPIHLHGSDFVVLAQSNEPWNATESPNLFRFDNPPRRDVAMLPGGGFLALAFRPDNPGAWLLHCHIAWHASSGLALQVLIRPKDHFLGDLPETKRVCQDWAAWPQTQQIDTFQDDSGV